MTEPSWPSYLALHESGELVRRAEEALESLASCAICPRNCGVNRLEDRAQVCNTGRLARVSSYFPHLGEEDCLRGWKGSGTIFIASCNLRCVFCQNFDISQGVRAAPARGSGPREIAALMLELQRLGCHNINLVTPEHVVPQVLEALVEAVERGLTIPVVYNTSAYDAPESLELLDGIVDIYMPDFKLRSAERGKRWLKAGDYGEVARNAILAMQRQVGPLQIDSAGVARRGLLIRHLVMPGCFDETREILGWIATELGPDTYVNLMDQYRPAGKVGGGRYPELDRTLRPGEFARARSFAREVGLERLDARRSF